MSRVTYGDAVGAPDPARAAARGRPIPRRAPVARATFPYGGTCLSVRMARAPRPLGTLMCETFQPIVRETASMIWTGSVRVV